MKTRIMGFVGFALGLALGLASLTAHAEIAQKFGTLEIHYNALSTDLLLPEVARAH